MDAESVLADEFARSLAERWKSTRHLEAHRTSLDDGAVRVIAEDAAALAVSNLSWHIALGDCVTARSLSEQLGLPVSVVVQDVRSGKLVGLEGRYETFLPLWQFPNHTPDKHPVETVSRVLNVFAQGLGNAFAPDLVVLWSATEQPELEDQEPRAVLSKMSPDRLEWSAKCTVAGLAR
ncbi:hypothetical protein SAMN06272775_3114 [Streptomyces sp. 2323.1]|uniref:hypothetical protein n=1 Tax=Streptomyces sp. 2323.1 TaxID=1938841 RepID=UPI000BB75E46|nr:hypothetical protein [Streptomyces sp. 2323.1]SOE12130.1 hypothetical protein SAMN06272775_3114 [Streptomyces sp. 2323.1]